MLVWDVVQVVDHDHNTSYKQGKNWVESHENENDAVQRAELMNYHKSTQCVGVSYVADGPFQEDSERY